MTPLAQLILSLAPGVVDLVKQAHQEQNPGVPPPTNEEVLAGFEQVFTDSDAKDEMMKNVLHAEIERGS